MYVMELVLILGVLCAGLSYFIARDRVPEKAPLATLLGFVLGPIGLCITFFLKPDAESGEEAVSAAGTGFDKLSVKEQNAKISEALNNKKAKSLDELKIDLKRMKTKL
jgi:hypothetical protein